MHARYFNPEKKFTPISNYLINCNSTWLCIGLVSAKYSNQLYLNLIGNSEKNSHRSILNYFNKL